MKLEHAEAVAGRQPANNLSIVDNRYYVAVDNAVFMVGTYRMWWMTMTLR